VTSDCEPQRTLVRSEKGPYEFRERYFGNFLSNASGILSAEKYQKITANFPKY
jgi:hypothetical protein